MVDKVTLNAAVGANTRAAGSLRINCRRSSHGSMRTLPKEMQAWRWTTRSEILRVNPKRQRMIVNRIHKAGKLQARGDALIEEIGRETYLARAGQAGIDLQSIYKRYSDITGQESLALSIDALGGCV